MFGLGETWDTIINVIFLIVTAGIAWHAIRFKDENGDTDFVRLLFGSIAATYFFLVLMKDFLGIPLF